MTKLGYAFKDPQLLERALTHRSVPGGNNERLEFLGDSVINFIMAAELYERFPNAKEGQLSRLRSTFVKGETLAEIAKDLQLGDAIRLGPGELKSGGFERVSILEDVMEAITGAIYLDSSMDICRECVLRWYGDRLDQASLQNQYKDPKTQLQELLQKDRFPLPEYVLVKTEGEAHEQTFYIHCVVESVGLTAEGVGTSRRRAEQQAAERMLDLISQQPSEDHD